MVGAGPEVFCLWPYVIAKMRSRGGEGATVLLNPVLLRDVFGVPDEDFIKRGIAKLCDVDVSSKNGKEQDGRRLVHISGHLYGVVNGAAYIALRSKERHAAAQAVYRKKQLTVKPRPPNPIQAGLVTDTKTLGQMVGEYGEDVGDDELTPEERKERVQEKIAREEAACEQVRSRFNPKYAHENTVAAQGEQPDRIAAGEA